MLKADIAIIGGSGFYELLQKGKSVKVKTPYGFPSDEIIIGQLGGKTVAFLPRHGKKHQFPPHKINYLANLWALKKLGVNQIISLTACGSLQKEIKRGDFVVIDQFVDRTYGRSSTFFDGPETVHISAAYPYCRKLSAAAFRVGKKLGLNIHPRGTLVVINGPRFSTRAESEWFTKMNWHVVNMTGYPEVVLAKESQICYSALGLVTDYDAGIVAKEKIASVKTEEVLKVFGENIEKAKKLVESLIKELPGKSDCACLRSLDGARIN